jgi:effector-binding domain-containing protein
MLSEPKQEERDQQPYVAVRTDVTMDTLESTLPPLIDEVSAWLGQKGIEPTGPPFFRYLVIDMASELTVDTGWPVDADVPEDERFRSDAFPAGRYVTTVHTGPFDQLEQATAELLAWADDNDIVWDVRSGTKGDEWASRTEFYLTNPDEEPDSAKWETELAFKLKDG